MSTILSYTIVSMQVSKSVVIPEYYSQDGNVQINNSFSFGVDISKSALLCKHRLALIKQDKVFADFVLDTIFMIAPDSLEKLKENGKLTIPEGFLVQCGSISYGSLRGIVLQDAKKKGLNNIIIPPLYVNEIIKEPMIIDLIK